MAARQFAIIVRRFTDNVCDLRAGEYLRRGDRVALACVCCGAVDTITPGEFWRVDADGYVSPLWLCESPSCPMVGAFLLLEGWAVAAAA